MQPQHLDIAFDSLHATIKSSWQSFFPFYLSTVTTTLQFSELPYFLANSERVWYRHLHEKEEEIHGFGAGSWTRARPPDIEGPSEIHSTVYRTARYRRSRTVGVGG